MWRWRLKGSYLHAVGMNSEWPVAPRREMVLVVLVYCTKKIFFAFSEFSHSVL